MKVLRPDVLVIGGGPAGLTAAADLRAAGVEHVVLVEREQELGGVPRHCHHQGFGLRDLHRALTGPAYAARVRDRARESGAELRPGTMVTGWAPEADAPVPRALVTSRAGREAIAPRAVVLATGVRERPRSARRLAGVRAPGGVLTTGTLQQRVYVEGARVPGRTVIVGAEHVSYSALATLRHGGSRPVAMVTELDGPETWAPVAVGGRLGFGVPLRTRVRVRRILGVDRVTGVELEHLDSGARETVACDRVLLTGDWIPDHELAVTGGIPLDRGTRGPRVDQALRTARPGVFAAGNALHPAETADVAALDGRHVAASVAAWLRDGGSTDDWPAAADGTAAAGGVPPADWPAAAGGSAPADGPAPVHRPTAGVAVEVDAPLRWIAPNVVVPGAGAPPRGRFALRADERGRRVPVRVLQDGRELWRGRLSHTGPARCSTLPAPWVGDVRADAGPVRVTLD